MPDVEGKVCFVVGPIGDEGSDIRLEADWLYELVIEPVFAKRPEFTVVRADKLTQPGMIDSQVINHLLNDDIVIADLTGFNPNAFYEIGIRHMAQKPIIHMFPPGMNLPFDLRSFRSIPFSRLTPASLKKAQKDLDEQLSVVVSEGFEVENPVTIARGRFRLEERASPEIKVLYDQLGQIQAKLRAMENNEYDGSTKSYPHHNLNRIPLGSIGAYRVYFLRRSYSNDDVMMVMELFQNTFGPDISLTYSNHEYLVIKLPKIIPPGSELDRRIVGMLMETKIVRDVQSREV